MKFFPLNLKFAIAGSVVLAAGLVGFAPGNSVTTDPEISAMVSNVDSSLILNTAETLENFRTRQSCSNQPEPGHGVTPARDFIFNQYSAIPGLEVRLDSFVHPSCPNSPTFNVIAWLPGKLPIPNQLVIVGGHYDSRTTNVNDAVSDAPGGNDAGAQTAVVLELARVLAGHQFTSTIVFISFSGEEQGLFGSASWDSNPRNLSSPVVTCRLETCIRKGICDLKIWALPKRRF